MLQRTSIRAALAIGLSLAMASWACAKDFPRFDALLKTLEPIKDGSCEHVVPNVWSRIDPAIRLYPDPDADNRYLLVQRFTYWNTKIFAVSSFTQTQSLGGRCREALVAFNMETGVIEAAAYLGCLTKKKWHTKNVYGTNTKGVLVGKEFLPDWEKQGEVFLSEAERTIAKCVKK